MPPFIDARGGGTVAMDEIAGTHSFHAQLPATPSFGFLPSSMAVGTDSMPRPDVYLGPTIEVQRGHPVALTVTNKLFRHGAATATTPAACAARGLVVVHPLAAFFDSSLGTSADIDKCAPRTAMHLHGGHTPTASDGGPMETFQAAGLDATDIAGGQGTFTYQYPNDQEAAGLWLHDHALGITRLNPEAGLAELYLVRDAWDTGLAGNPLGLPTAGQANPIGTTGMQQYVHPYEIPLVLQDRSFNLDGTLAYPTAATSFHPVWAPESFGTMATVNGKVAPNLGVDRGLYRFRIYNGSNARFYRLALADSMGRTASVPMYQIGSEGGMFNAAVPVASIAGGLVVAPGERADVLVDFRRVPAGTRYTLTNNAKAPYPNGVVDLRTIMQFSVGSAAGFSPPAGTALASLPNATLRGGAGRAPAIAALPVTGAPVRTMFLNEIIDPVTGIPVEVLQNNLHYLDPATMQPATAGTAAATVNTVEVWQIVNTTADTHPIHLHATQFQVLDRRAIDGVAYLAAVNPALPGPSVRGTGVMGSGGALPAPDPTPFLRGGAKAPLANERGWKDTVEAHPGEMVRIVVPFGGTAAGIAAAFTGDTPTAPQRFTGAYVWHCHILEHEENDMMQAFRIG